MSTTLFFFLVSSSRLTPNAHALLFSFFLLSLSRCAVFAREKFHKKKKKEKKKEEGEFGHVLFFFFFHLLLLAGVVRKNNAQKKGRRRRRRRLAQYINNVEEKKPRREEDDGDDDGRKCANTTPRRTWRREQRGGVGRLVTDRPDIFETHIVTKLNGNDAKFFYDVNRESRAAMQHAGVRLPGAFKIGDFDTKSTLSWALEKCSENKKARFCAQMARMET